MLRKSVSSEAPSTISGDDIGRKIEQVGRPPAAEPVADERERDQRPERGGDDRDVSAAISSETTIALRSAGTASQWRQLSRVKPCQV